MTDDFIFPKFNDGKGSKVETLPEGDFHTIYDAWYHAIEMLALERDESIFLTNILKRKNLIRSQQGLKDTREAIRKEKLNFQRTKNNIPVA